MRRFAACLKKDLNLFFGNKTSAFLSLFLPLIIALSSLLGFGFGTREELYFKPFKVAVCDMDGTLMSRMLIAQLKELDVFSEVVRAEDRSELKGEEASLAGVISIPKDFFYSVFDMENTPIVLELNPMMPLESELLKSMVGSVSKIITANQKTKLAEYTLEYGEPDEGELRELYAEASLEIISDALGRKNLAMAAKLGGGEEVLQIYAFILALLLLLVPAYVMSTLSEELESGIIGRYRAAGGSSFVLFLSKFFVNCIASIPLAIMAAAILEIKIDLVFLIILFISCAAAFFVFLLIALLTKEKNRMQMLGGVICVLSLLFSGAVYPIGVVPGYSREIAKLTVPYYTEAALLLRNYGASIKDLIPALLPLLLFVLAAIPASTVIYKKARAKV